MLIFILESVCARVECLINEADHHQYVRILLNLYADSSSFPTAKATKYYIFEKQWKLFDTYF